MLLFEIDFVFINNNFAHSIDNLLLFRTCFSFYVLRCVQSGVLNKEMSSENPIVVASLSQTQEADQPLILSLDWWKPYAGQLMDLHHSSIPCFQQVHQ